MKKYILLLLLLSMPGLYAQVEFKAVPSKTKLGINERLRVEFTMNEDGDNFMPPSFQGFRVSGPSQMISNSWINGKRSFSKTYTYLLTPMAKGTFTIGQASIEIDGKPYKTSPFKITVTEAVKLTDPTDPYSPPQQIQNVSDEIHLVAEVSKASPYVNEPVTVLYKLYVSHEIGIRSSREVSSPKYNDFWSQSIDIKDFVVQEGQYNGKDFRYVVLRKAILYPQKSGRLEIEPLSLELLMDVPTGRRDFFGRAFITQANKIVSADKKYITVKPLPENNKPADFTGAVGKFDFKVTPSKTRLNAGESLQLTVSVSGKGNLKLFNLPKPVVPAALEMYDPEHKEKVSTPLTGMQGSISDVYTIIPQNKGKYPVKAMSFSYFDPTTGRYKTLTSPEIMIDVEGSPVASADGNAPVSQKQKVEAGEQFRFIALETSLRPAQRDDFLGSGLFYSLLAAPFLLIPLVVALRKKKQAMDSDVAGNRIRQNNRLAKKYLSEAKKHLGNKEPFYISLEKALHNFLKAKLTIETSEMSKERIKEFLVSRNADAGTINGFIAIMNSCEFARYAPSSGAAMQQDYNNAVSVITALEKQI
ncbi:BatD protein [Flavobacterium cyanobacteriorum]|uniref:BatD protein n=1 Tax=Flavobacterium cyanobacteriorum TaxID=2022802 RepID=A0A255Z5E4_9FLAO|nr:BatD family protein [Flavobacterium cyanobacteriorum]OYQ36651.1 BatD protein [Flavobacterium cyanobacteriorum]